MYQTKPDHVRRWFRTVLILCVGAPVLGACSLFRLDSRRRMREADSAFVELFDALADQVSDLADARGSSRLQKWIERQVGLPQVALLAAYGEDERPLAVACLDPAVRQGLTGLWQRRPPSGSGVATVELPEKGEVKFFYRSQRVAGRSPQPAYLGLLLVRASGSSVWAPLSGGAWRGFYLPVAGLGLAALLFSLVWADGQVLGPLARFLAAGRRALQAGGGQGCGPGPESLDGLLKAMEDLPAECEHWREEADQLSRSVDRRVAAMTRHISRELRIAFRQAATDPLTGLGNRRVLDENLGTLIGQSLDAYADLSLVLIDLGCFKSLNDTYGHQAGDDVLRFVGGLLSGCLRDDDIAVRLGGDEFVLLLPGVGSKQARKIALRLAALFRQRYRSYELSPPLTMSAGVVSLMDYPTPDAQEFLERADRALYAAKEGGSHGVETYTLMLMPRTARG